MVEGVTEGPELRFVIPGTQAQDQPAAANLVHRIGHLGQQGRVAEGGTAHQSAEFDPLRDCGQGGQNRPPFPDALRWACLPLPAQ